MQNAVSAAEKQIQKDRQYETDDQAGDEGKIEGKTFAMDSDVAGKSAEPGYARSKPQDQPQDKAEDSKDDEDFAEPCLHGWIRDLCSLKMAWQGSP